MRSWRSKHLKVKGRKDRKERCELASPIREYPSNPYEVDEPFDPLLLNEKFICRSKGSGTISSRDRNVIGDISAFTHELKISDSITAAGQMKKTVTAILSDTSLTVDSAFEPDITGTKYTCSYQSIESGISRGLESIQQRYRMITKDDYERGK